MTTAEPTVTIEGATYTVRHGGCGVTACSFKELVAADGTVAGMLTLRRSNRGAVVVRKGVAKLLSQWAADKLARG